MEGLLFVALIDRDVARGPPFQGATALERRPWVLASTPMWKGEPLAQLSSVSFLPVLHKRHFHAVLLHGVTSSTFVLVWIFPPCLAEGAGERFGKYPRPPPARPRSIISIRFVSVPRVLRDRRQIPPPMAPAPINGDGLGLLLHHKGLAAGPDMFDRRPPGAGRRRARQPWQSTSAPSSKMSTPCPGRPTTPSIIPGTENARVPLHIYALYFLP